MEEQKKPPEVFYEKSCSQKFHTIHRKTPVPESLFNKVELKKRLWHRCFPVNFAKFLRTLLGDCFCKKKQYTAFTGILESVQDNQLESILSVLSDINASVNINDMANFHKFWKPNQNSKSKKKSCRWLIEGSKSKKNWTI